MAAAFWSMLGQAANVMQVTGVDGFGIASMIVQAARAASRNRDLCQLLANKVQIVSDLLRELQIPELRRHRSTRRPLDELRRALFCAYMLVWSCGQQQRNTSQLYQLWKSADMALMLRQAQDEIDGYIILIPMITAVASVRSRGTQEVQDSVTNDPAPELRPQLSIEEVTESPTHEMERLSIEHEHVGDLVSMIEQSAGTARHNRNQCQQLAQQARIAGGQLGGMLDTQALEWLEETLFRAYMLVCFCGQYNRSQLRQMFTGADMDSVFRLAQDEISSRINLMVSSR